MAVADPKIGMGLIGDNLIGGAITLFEGITDNVGNLKLRQLGENAYEVTVNGVTEQVISPDILK